MTIEEVKERLMELAEEKNAKRSSMIIPRARPILGARVPDLRKLAKQIAKEDYRGFLEQCREDFFEEQMLKAFVLGYARDDIETILSYADRFVPGIGDWCVNDGFCQTFSIARKHKESVFAWLLPYVKEQKEYSQRMAAVLLMSHFLTDDYIVSVFEVLNRLSFDAYYTRMGVAWCVATAYAKYPKETYAFLLDNRLDDWTYNKAIQKMRESLRVSKEDKEMLQSMRRK